MTNPTPLTIVGKLLRLALAEPASITPANGKPWERWLAGGIGLHSQPITASASYSRTDHFVMAIFEYLDKLNALNQSDFLWYWFGNSLHPLLAPAGQSREIRLVQAILDGSITDEAAVVEFCAAQNVVPSDMDLIVKKSLSLIDLLQFLDELNDINVSDLALAARFEERALMLKRTAAGMM